jgi:hypothetical protein
VHFGHDAALENCIFYISSLYEFSHNLDPTRTWGGGKSRNANYGTSGGGFGSIRRLDARELDDLSPFLDFFGDKLAEVGGRTCKRRVAKLRKPRFHRGISQSSVDLPIELLDDVGGRVLWCSNTRPRARVVAWQKLTQGWNVRQRRRARRRCDCQRAQLAGSDKRDRRGKGIEYNLDPTTNQVIHRR